MTLEQEARLIALCRKDAQYHKLAEERNTCMEQYRLLLQRLSAQDASMLEKCIMLTAQTEARRTELAYEMGKEDGRPRGFAFF